jgi:hypothetical protein
LFSEMFREGVQHFGQALFDRGSRTVGALVDIEEMESPFRLDYGAECGYGKGEGVLKPRFIMSQGMAAQSSQVPTEGCAGTMRISPGS